MPQKIIKKKKLDRFINNVIFLYFQGFFDKAKKRILGDKPPSESSQGGEPSRREELGGLSGYDPAWWEDQELG